MWNNIKNIFSVIIHTFAVIIFCDMFIDLLHGKGIDIVTVVLMVIYFIAYGVHGLLKSLVQLTADYYENKQREYEEMWLKMVKPFPNGTNIDK